MRHPVQGRAQAENAGGQRPGGVVAGEERRGQEQSAADVSCPRPMHHDGVSDRETSGNAASCARHASGTEPQRDGAELDSVFTSPDGEVSRRQPASALRDCTRDPARGVLLSSPLRESRGAELGGARLAGCPPRRRPWSRPCDRWRPGLPRRGSRLMSGRGCTRGRRLQGSGLTRACHLADRGGAGTRTGRE